ncbi:MAG: OmpA family protein, partial [Alphaproteobacteria bacterium]
PAPTPPRASTPAAPKVAMVNPPANLGAALALGFQPGSASLTRDAERELGQLAGSLRDTEQRLQLKAFASAEGDNTSRARRTSLSRALAVRSYLIEAGIRSTRIDVRALGVARDGGAEDRVDVILLGQ